MPVCGNGVAETSDPGDFTCHEPCDGADLRGATCASIGHRSGTLSCRDDCLFDQSNCESCAPLDSTVLACGANRQPGDAVVVAATDAAIALAFLREGGLWVELLAPDLSTVTEARRVASSEAVDLDLIATPDGWLLAALGESIDLFWLDEAGTLSSTSNVASGALAGVIAPGVKLTTRSGGGAFALWRTPDGEGGEDLYVVALSADGSLAASPSRVGTVVDQTVGAIATADGLLVAARLLVGDGSANSRLFIVRIDANGAVAGSRQTVDDFGSYPILAVANDGGAVLAYYDFEPPASTQWIKLDEAGLPEIGPIAIDTTEFQTGPSPVTLVTTDTGFVVVTGWVSNTDEGVGSVVVGDDGMVTVPLAAIVQDPSTARVEAARCGPEIVVAYETFDANTSWIALARIAR
jgi:hypothetical protein